MIDFPIIACKQLSRTLTRFNRPESEVGNRDLGLEPRREFSCSRFSREGDSLDEDELLARIFVFTSHTERRIFVSLVTLNLSRFGFIATTWRARPAR